MSGRCGGDKWYGRGRGLRLMAAWARSEGGNGASRRPLTSGELTNAMRIAHADSELGTPRSCRWRTWLGIGQSIGLDDKADEDVTVCMEPKFTRKSPPKRDWDSDQATMILHM